LRFAETVTDFQNASLIKFFISRSVRPVEFTKKSIVRNEFVDACSISKLLSEIQDMIGERVPSLFGSDLSSGDLNTIRTVHTIVTKGKMHLDRVSFEAELMDPPKESVEKLLNEKGIDFKIADEPATSLILGKQIELGRRMAYFAGALDLESRKRVEDALKSGNLKCLKIRVESIPHLLPAVVFYPKWISDADAKMQEFEMDRAKRGLDLAR
jgi:hypothetical protein